MESSEKITSVHNPKVKTLVHLRERRVRDREKKFLIEGYRELLRAQEGLVVCEMLFICPELFLGENEDRLIEALRLQGTRVYSCAPHVFKKISYRDRPDGLIAVAKQWEVDLEAISLTQPSLIVVAEAIEKPGNLGTILRSADGVGADLVLVCDQCTDIYNPNTVRASVGTLFTRPVIETSSEKALAFLRKRNCFVVAAMPDAPLRYTDATLSENVAIVLGTEQLGLSDFWKNSADIAVTIPMCGAADSLNVAMAGTLLLYEALRQRT